MSAKRMRMLRHDVGALGGTGTMSITEDPGSLDDAPTKAELARLVESYVDDLREQAAILLELPGHLEVENHAEAGAYLAVAEDLTRLLTGELSMAHRASA